MLSITQSTSCIKTQLDNTLEVVVTKFNFHEAQRGNQPLEIWLSTMLDPRIDFFVKNFNYDGKNVVMISEKVVKRYAILSHS